MKADVLERLSRIARGEIVPVPRGTGGTGGTSKTVPLEKCPSFHAFPLFHHDIDAGETARVDGGTAGGMSSPDAFDMAERTAIAIVDGRVPPAYADAWAALQIRKWGNVSAAEWFQAVDDAGRFLDEWAEVALNFGWRSDDIFGWPGLAWFCAGERVRALGPDNAITKSGRIFTRSSISAGPTKRGI